MSSDCFQAGRLWGPGPNAGWKCAYAGLVLSETGQTLCGEIRLDVFMNLTRAGQSYCEPPIEGTVRKIDCFLCLDVLIIHKYFKEFVKYYFKYFIANFLHSKSSYNG